MDTPELSDTSSDLSTPPTSPTHPPDGFEFFPGCSQSSNETSPPPLVNVDKPEAKPPPHRTRKSQPKPRITTHLDLTQLVQDGPEAANLDRLMDLIRKRKNIVVVAGAGISVSAGIPDFRSSRGLFTTLKKDHKLRASGKQLFDANIVYQDENMISSFHDMVRELSDMCTSAKPTAFHNFLDRVAETGHLLRLYTQNVDGIDASLPMLETKIPLVKPFPPTIQLHGGLKKMICQKCNHMSDFQSKLFNGPDPPLCPECHRTDIVRTESGYRSRGVGKLRPRMVLYNEHNPDEEAICSVIRADIKARPGALIVAGTSLKIPGVRLMVREMCRAVRGRRDGITIWINNDSLPVGKEFKDCWDYVIKGDCDTVAKFGMKKWDEDSKCANISVVVPPPPKDSDFSIEEILTPSSNDDTKPIYESVNPTSCLPVSLDEPSVLPAAISTASKKETKKAAPTRKPSTKKRKSTAQGDKSSKKVAVAPINQIFTGTKANASHPTSAKTTTKASRMELNVMHDMSPSAVQNIRPTGPLASDDSDMKYTQNQETTIHPSSIPKNMGPLLASPNAEICLST
ncbi:hypothetical protein FQN57_005223 [Myotisia sp. PD_48]|nr:hypothetical protein FQN57_005223 [Myotisia sp. PD_48]